MFNFIGFLFSLLKEIYNTCALHTQVNRQASVARILFAGFFGIFSSSLNKKLLDAQIKEYNTKISTRQNTYDEEHNNIEITPTAPQLPPLPQNHSLSLVPRNFRNLAITKDRNSRPNIAPSPIQHIMTHHSQNDNTYKQIIHCIIHKMIIHTNKLYTASFTQSSTSTETPSSTHRAYRTFKRKLPNHPFPTKPGTACEYINHPQHTNTKNFLAITLPSFPQYTLNTPNDTNDTRNFVDEHVLMPTLHWTAYYHFTNPLCLPLTNTHDSIEKNKDMLYRLTTTLTPRQFTYE